MEHSFDIDVAREIGIEGAIILKAIYFWCKRNEANGKNIHEGYAWTYNTRKAFQEMFPYLSEKKIRSTLERLERLGYIKTGNFNSSAYDRTLWYTVTNTGVNILICPKRQMELPETANGNAQEGRPIPDIKPVKKPVVYRARYGTFDPEEAFERALERTYSEEVETEQTVPEWYEVHPQDGYRPLDPDGFPWVL